MNKKWSMLLAACGSATVIACSAGRELESTAIQQSAVGIPSSGFVPYPLLMRINVTPPTPRLGTDGKYQGAWNGSLVDLVAADAYASCATQSPLYPVFSTNVDRAGRDKYLEYLRARMSEFHCTASPFGNDIDAPWVANRTSSQCNVDSRSGNFASIEVVPRGVSPYTSFFDSSDNFGLVGIDGIIEQARYQAGLELDYADLNLCMAQHLREHINSGQSLFTSSTDLTELLAVIRERAQLASIYYSLLAKVISVQGPAPLSVTSAENDWLLLVRRWLETVATPQQLTQIGEDFATAVRLLIWSTRELATTLERSAGQRPVGVAGFDRPQRDWGMEQPRIRLMNLLYGGDPIGQPTWPPTRGRGLGGAAILEDVFSSLTDVPAFVSAEMSDPRVGTLLGLARAADALFMKIVPVSLGGVASLDVQASADRLYQSVETAIRFQRCERETPGNCDAQQIGASLPGLSQFTSYDLWKVHRVERRNAYVLAQAFAEAFGALPSPEGPLRQFRRYDGSMHLTGQHAVEVISGEDWLHVDKDFGTVPFEGHELGADYARRVYLPETFLLDADPYDQGFSVQAPDGLVWQRTRELGAVSALAFVREAVTEGSLVQGPGQTFFAAAGDVLPSLDRELGPRSVIVRPVLSWSASPCVSGNYEAGADCEDLFAFGDVNGHFYRTSSVTTSSDPMVELTVAPQSAQLFTVARDPNSEGFDGVDRATLDSYPTVSASTTAFGGYAAGYEKRDFDYQLQDTPVQNLLLRGPLPGGGAGEYVYDAVSQSVLFAHEAQFTSHGGELNAIGERAMAVLPSDWSRPAYDAFGLAVDWVPPADASLVGGAAGEQSYTYYLRVARQAAEEATAAVQVAIDNLVLETEQRVDLELAEQRAQTIADIERSALCGRYSQCEQSVAMRQFSRPLPDCTQDDLGAPLTGTAQARCEAAVAARTAIMPQFLVTEAAYSATTPSFSEFGGGELEGVLVGQWNALQTLALVDQAFVSNARALGSEVFAAQAELASATANRDAALADVQAAYAELDVNDAQVQQQLAALAARESAYEAEYGAAKGRLWECEEEAFREAASAGTSYSNVGLHYGGPTRWEIWSGPAGPDFPKSWSPGPWYAQRKLCGEVTVAFNVMLASEAATVSAMEIEREALLLQYWSGTPAQRTALLEREEAARAAYDAAVVAAHTSMLDRWAQVMSSLAELQGSIGDVLASQVEYNQLLQRVRGIAAQEQLEKDLAQKQADARFGIRRKFQSYDMWRARALLEGARRLSVAARRGIESHFVVDLSDLEATQAFVESPALWADEIYGADLDAPAVVGLSAAPKIEGAVFPNKLIDYVENLERFVQGYTISYPTSLAEPDTEVLTLPGPDVRQQLPDGDQSIEILAADAVGWTFFCEDTGAWLSNPGVGEVPLQNTVATLCAGKAPARARYGFTLDPWARLGGSIAFAPPQQRHNVRWTRLAVNLVGTGIRDCEVAPDPVDCYAEPFLRYDLKHLGPAWTTNHAEDWRAFNVPAAFIEGAKALATEEWLDPLTNSWNTPLVANAARGELFGRSVGGSYVLELELTPELRLERIERVQLLVQTQYWVRQE